MIKEFILSHDGKMLCFQIIAMLVWITVCYYRYKKA